MLVPKYEDVILKEIENDFRQTKSEGGILLPNGLHMSQETGDFERSDDYVQIGEVVAVGSKCDQYNVGDVVFYEKGGAYTLPYRNYSYKKISARAIICAVEKD